MLARLDPAVVPPLIAAEGPRVLLADVPGEDHWDGPLPVLLRVLGMLVGLQRDWVDRVHELVEVGAPDWRVGPFVPAVTDLVARTAGELDDDTVAALQALLAGLPDRFAAVACVRGAGHAGARRLPPGQHPRRRPSGRSVLLDWGDCGIGNPLLDQAAFLSSIGEAKREPVRAAWADLWRDAVPGSRPGPGGRAAGAGRCAPAGADLPDLPGRHRAGRAGLPRERPGHLAAPGRRAQLTLGWQRSSRLRSAVSMNTWVANGAPHRGHGAAAGAGGGGASSGSPSWAGPNTRNRPAYSRAENAGRGMGG